MSDEIGKELMLEDLKALEKPKVVVTRREDRNVGVTVWLIDVREHSVHFYGGVGKIHFLALIEDSKLIDDTGRQVHVYEYLGEV
jgi:hypothetical protein